MELGIAIAILLLWAVSLLPLRKLLHSPARPDWLQGGVGAELAMLTHLLLLVLGLALLAHSQIYG
ncbi:MAG: hypothetical protein FJX68_17740 [Alphaproteobacteria bacterium]|nr:hypothetical protein [Alphaproteobacteria bacterium]